MVDFIKDRPSDSPESPHREVLSGWKDIANYLDKGVRTVQRYEYDLNLPVRRPAGRPGGSVLATKGDLDQWVLAGPIRKPVKALKVYAQDLELQQRIARMKEVCEETMRLMAECKVSRERLHGSIRLTVPNVNDEMFGHINGSMHDRTSH